MLLRLLGCCLLLTGGSVHAESVTTEQPLEEVLRQLQQQYEVVISYNARDLKNVNVNFEVRAEESFLSAVDRALAETGLRCKPLGMQFYVIHKGTLSHQRKIRKLRRRIDDIRRIGNADDGFMVTNRGNIGRLAADLRPLTVSGRVTDDAGIALPGATIMGLGTRKGTTSEADGSFSLMLPANTEQVVVTFTGFDSQMVNVSQETLPDIQLKEGVSLEEVTVFGSRSACRSIFASAVPIDKLSAAELARTGAMTLDDQLATSVPSFSTGHHPVSDAAAHFNPVGLRGLLPSRTLILINGKRKNASALLYSYVTASRGEVGVDMKSIGAEAVQEVEVLRDGAAAQYGSDAIAGVINLRLKEKIRPFLDLSYATTNAGDGQRLNLAGGFSAPLGEKGFATFTLGYRQQQRSQRAGTITSPTDETAHWGTDIFSAADFADYLARNPRAGFQVGLPDSRLINASLNAEYALGREGEVTRLYAFGSLMSRKGRSPQFARGPYWVAGFEAIYPDQDFFLPEMAPTILDGTLTVGANRTWRGWRGDLSSTIGNARIDYYINNSFNQSLGAASPIDFYNGAHRFTQLVNNLDVRRAFPLAEKALLNVSFGLEQRTEIFRSFAGEFASYGDGTPDVTDRVGSESFSGLRPADVVYGRRGNIGFYAEVSSDLSPRLQLGAAARHEYYSDFGGNLSWKINGLLRVIPEKINVRMALGNGFRAPSLHQVHFTSTTTTLTPDGVVQNRILNNRDPALDLLQIPELQPETSLNLSTGMTCRLTPRWEVSADLYRIDVLDRIVLSGQISRQAGEDSPINDLLSATNTNSAGFFLNAVNTTTSGVDLVVTMKKMPLGKGQLRASLAVNLHRTRVRAVKLPSFIEGNDLRDEVFSREDISRLERWRPRQRAIFQLQYNQGKLATMLGVNYYGAVQYRHPKDPADDVRFRAKALTNCAVSWAFRPGLRWRMGIDNLFNVFPDDFTTAYNGTPTDRNIDFVGRFQYPWQTLQIGIDGLRAFTGINYEF
jgi:iron complex outermembrane receptor protein